MGKTVKLYAILHTILLQKFPKAGVSKERVRIGYKGYRKGGGGELSLSPALFPPPQQGERHQEKRARS